MFNIKTIAEFTKIFENENLHSEIIKSHMKIEAWFRNQWVKYPAPFYSSIDIRNSGYKIAPVDTNLFPAGFNNLDKGLEFLYIAAAQPDMNHLQLTCIGIETRLLEHYHLSHPPTSPSHLQFVK